MIYCGSGSGFDFGKVLVPVTVPVPVPDLFSTVFQQQKICTNLAFSMLTATLFAKKLAPNLVFFYFCITYYVGSGSNSGSGTRTHNCSGSATANVSY